MLEVEQAQANAEAQARLSELRSELGLAHPGRGPAGGGTCPLAPGPAGRAVCREARAVGRSTVASPYRGRVEWGTTGVAKIEIDDLDSTTWRGVPSNGGVLVRGSETYPWLVGVILLEGPRAGEYATADLVVEDDPVSMRFEGRSAFASTLSEKDLEAAKVCADRRDEQLAMMRSPVPRADGQPVFHDVRVSALDRPRRNTDVLPEQMEHMAERIPIDPGSIRLALEHDDHRVYLAAGSATASSA